MIARVELGDFIGSNGSMLPIHMGEGSLSHRQEPQLLVHRLHEFHNHIGANKSVDD
jgi:hypothetical protein